MPTHNNKKKLNAELAVVTSCYDVHHIGNSPIELFSKTSLSFRCLIPKPCTVERCDQMQRRFLMRDGWCQDASNSPPNVF